MIRITILCDNIVGLPFETIGEHGFAAFVETPDGNLLFDTGCGKGIINNALALGKDLRDIRQILISHGHFDHTEGLPQVLRLHKEIEVIGHPGIFQKRISRKGEGHAEITRFIGISHQKEVLDSLGATFHFEKGFYEVSKDVFLTGEVPRVTHFEKGAQDQFVFDGESYVLDPVIDDQALVIRTSEGLVVLCGCAHAGMMNTIEHAMAQTGDTRLYAVLGGTHLMFLSQDQLDASLGELKAHAPKQVAVSHCTGVKAACRLMQDFKEAFTVAHVGSVFEFA